MSTPSRSPLGAMLAHLTRLTGYTIRTTPGLVLITLGSGICLLGHPVIGLAAALAGALIYHAQCGRTAYTDCIRCHGTGHHAKDRGRGHGLPLVKTRTVRRCSWCRGKGVRIRWGRAVMNTYRRATHTSTTTPGTAHDARPARQAGPESYAHALQRATDRQATSALNSQDRDRA